MKAAAAKARYRHKTVPVDSFSPNRWGLYNVHGNVEEWTQDCWNDSNSGNPGDGSAMTRGDCSNRALRGGSRRGEPENVRAASRDANPSDNLNFFIGFRVARTLTP